MTQKMNRQLGMSDIGRIFIEHHRKHLNDKDFYDSVFKEKCSLSPQRQKKGSVNSLNRLFFVVYKTILKVDKYPRVICVKHNDIQKLRKDWLEYQKLADTMLKEYKEEKGDFYKNNSEYHKI